MTTLNLSEIHFAVVFDGGKQLGNCYRQDNYLIYSRDNVDDTTYDHCYADKQKSFNRRLRMFDFLPKANAGCELGKFSPVPGEPGLFVASYYYRTDSSD